MTKVSAHLAVICMTSPSEISCLFIELSFVQMKAFSISVQRILISSDSCRHISSIFYLSLLDEVKLDEIFYNLGDEEIMEIFYL